MKIKRILAIILFLFALSISIIFILKSADRLEEKKESSLAIQSLSRITKNLLAGDSQTEYLNSDSSTVLIYFNSECESCKSEFDQLEEKFTTVDNPQLVFVSYQNFDDINSFLSSYKIREKKNAFLFRIYPEDVQSTFGNSTVPQVFVYKENKLIKSFRGKTEVSDILKALK